RRLELQTLVALVLWKEHVSNSPVSRIPKNESVCRSGQKIPAVWRESRFENRSIQRPKLLEFPGIPQQCFRERTSDKQVSIWRNRDRFNYICMFGQRRQKLSRINVPDFDRLVLAPRKKPPAIRRKSDAGCDVLVARQAEKLIALALLPKITPFKPSK